MNTPKTAVSTTAQNPKTAMSTKAQNQSETTQVNGAKSKTHDVCALVRDHYLMTMELNERLNAQEKLNQVFKSKFEEMDDKLDGLCKTVDAIYKLALQAEKDRGNESDWIERLRTMIHESLKQQLQNLSTKTTTTTTALLSNTNKKRPRK